MVNIIPITKANDTGASRIALAVSSDFIVVRLIDFISLKTLQPNSAFTKIVRAGGLRSYYKEKRPFILSLIAPDHICAKFLPYDYAYFIKNLKADYFTTPDCETYDHEGSTSIREIKKALILTEHLITLCKESKPIGQVKGCNESLVKEHAKVLSLLGIEYMLFHTGDFLRNGDQNMILKARNLAVCIRPYAKRLFLYGMGSQNNILTFSFADYYVTNTYFIAARNGKRFVGIKKYQYHGGYSLDVVRSNLTQLLTNIMSSREQKQLFNGGDCPWVADQEEIVLAIATNKRR